MTDKGRTVGLLRLKHLKDQPLGTKIGDIDYEELRYENLVEPTTTLPRLFRKLLQRPSCLVVDEEERVIGLVHISDLNRQAVRVYFYLLLAAVEMGLALVISRSYPGDAWMNQLRPSNRKRLKQNFDKQQSKGVELSLIEAAYFSDLIQVLQSDQRLRERLIPGEQSRDILGNLNKWLRNSIMHPVKPLVTSEQDVGKLLDFYQLLCSLIEQIQQEPCLAEED